MSIRGVAKGIARSAGLLPLYDSAIQSIGSLRKDLAEQRRFREFRRSYGAIFADAPNPRPTKRALFVTPHLPSLELNLVLMKSLGLAGYAVVPIENLPGRFRPYHALAGTEPTRSWQQWARGSQDAGWDEARRMLEGCGTLEELLTLERDGVRVGMITASSLIRTRALGDLDLANPHTRKLVTEYLARSLRASLWARALLDDVRPDVAIFLPTEYTPKGELFETCIRSGIDTIAVESAQRNDSIVLRRYSADSINRQVASLSPATWELMLRHEWGDAQRAEIGREMDSGYSSGDWYFCCRTQAGTRQFERDELYRALALDPDKRTAVVFPHVMFDGPFSWARPLFTTYERWLVETLRVASRNDRVNWVVKIHPAYGVKARGRTPPEHELIARTFGDLPPHVKVLPADSAISTRSLFDVMDWCVTVRGTVGLEAAARGIPALIAAQCHYSHKGFTVDPVSREDYLQHLDALERIPPVTPEAQDLALRYAYGLFLLKPLQFSSVTWTRETLGTDSGPSKARPTIHIDGAGSWDEAVDLHAFVDWVRDSKDEDFLGRRLDK